MEPANAERIVQKEWGLSLCGGARSLKIQCPASTWFDEIDSRFAGTFQVSFETRTQYIGVMTTSLISSASPIMSASAVQNLSRPSSAISSSALTDLNSSHANGPASVRTGLQLIPSPNEAAAALQSSALQIARLQSNPAQPTARAASEAYMTQAAAQTQVAQQEGAKSSLSFNTLA
jgi:hypothetical protein